MKIAPPLLLTSLLVLPTSCGLAAGAGLGYVISREVLPGAVHEAHVAADVDLVWPMTMESLEILHDLGSEVSVTEGTRRVETRIDGSVVTVQVAAYEMDRTVVNVEAQGPLRDDPHTARVVLENILDRVEREAVRVQEASAQRP